MPTFSGVLTEKGAEHLAKYGNAYPPENLFSYFKVGEGGWVDSGGRVPRTPDPTLTDLDIILDFARPVPRYNEGISYGYFTKVFIPGDFSWAPGFPRVQRISAKLTTFEYNFKDDDTLIYDFGGAHVSPHIYEIGLFDAYDQMLVYGTFDEEVKDVTKQIENIVRMTWTPG